MSSADRIRVRFRRTGSEIAPALDLPATPNILDPACPVLAALMAIACRHFGDPVDAPKPPRREHHHRKRPHA